MINSSFNPIHNLSHEIDDWMILVWFIWTGKVKITANYITS